MSRRLPFVLIFMMGTDAFGACTTFFWNGPSITRYFVCDLASDTATGAIEGDVRFNKDTNLIQCYNGASWGICSSGSGSPGPAITRLSADQSTGSSSFADLPGMTFSVSASTVYHFSCEMSYTSAASTTALHLSINGPASPTAMSYSVLTSTGLTGIHAATQTAYDTVTNPGTSNGATAEPVRIYGTLENGTNSGTLAIRFKSEVSLSSVVVKRGSYCTFY